jgi:hypothetical protein
MSITQYRIVSQSIAVLDTPLLVLFRLGPGIATCSSRRVSEGIGISKVSEKTPFLAIALQVVKAVLAEHNTAAGAA